MEIAPDIVARLRSGDAAAQRIVDERIRPMLVRFCAGYLGVGEMAEDAAQEVLARAVRSPVDPDDPRLWLFQIARRHCLNVLRGLRRRKDAIRLQSAAAIADSLTGPLTRLQRLEDRARVLDAIGRLSPEQREAIWLRYAEGLSREEIARLAGVSVPAIKSRLYEGMRRLKTVLRPEDRTP